MGFKKERNNMILLKRKLQEILNFRIFNQQKELIKGLRKQFRVFWIKTLKDREMSSTKDR